MFQETRELPVTAPTRVGQFHELAEAIRIGCKLRPRQAFGVLDDHCDSACALGAASAAGYNVIDPLFLPHKIWGMVLYRNDRLRWTREAIADWLDTL